MTSPNGKGGASSSSPHSPDRKRSLEAESSSDEEGLRGGRFKRQARGSEEESAPQSPVAEDGGDLTPPQVAPNDSDPSPVSDDDDQTPSFSTDNQPQANYDAAEASYDAAAAAAPAPEQDGQPFPEDYDPSIFQRIVSLRAVITTKEAGIIIGKQGRHVSDIRAQSGARVTISENVPSAPDRVVTVTGMVDVVAKAYSLIARKIVEDQASAIPVNERHCTFRVLVPHARMGSIIGKGGKKVKDIQEASGAHLVAGEEILPGSTERALSVTGVIDSIHIAAFHLAAILQEHPERIIGSVPYKPQSAPTGYASPSYGMTSPPGAYYGGPPGVPGVPIGHPMMSPGGPVPLQPTLQVQQIFIPNDMVGAIIGKAGAKINEIRHASGCQIKIGDAATGQNERLVTITGSPENNQMALYLLYSRLEQEKSRHR
ncbi:hypothetical protein HK104_007101 [Borealophlyctis nickersoniae]|nr:hypothetical protein HK104_007101 [Borealophlyctis nickersoniae]